MIDSARWNRIEALFAEASELPFDQRSSWLDDACADDEDLKREVHSLLRAHDAAEPALASTLVDAITDPLAGLPDGRLGPYRIIRELGRGGMGTVFLAERADGAYKGLVAIKVSRDGPGQDEILRRLHAERQILANLQHPNIARLLDGGTTTGGAPFVVMEYIEGTRLDRYCDEHRLDLRARISLLRQLADAVEYANRNLVVHRDIKPANILVKADGTPILLDFGIAKLLHQDDAKDETRTALRLLTPAYASPEQIVGAAITTASDVYSLGVVAYEVLTGRSPYAVDGVDSSDLLRQIADAPVTRPSAAVTTGAAEELAERRAMSVEQLRRAFSGDLDAILLTALRKEPERRYHSAGAFGTDLGRYLDGLPVAARPDTLGYRTVKFVRRHRVGVAAAAAAVIASIAFVSFYTVRVTQERNTAVTERAKAEQVTALLTSVFELANPELTRGEAISAVDLLHRGARRVADSLEAQPDVQATMMHTIGQAYVKLGMPDSARRFFDRAVELREQLYGRRSRDVAQSMMALAEWHLEKGAYDSALTQMRSAVEILDAVADGDDQMRALGLYNLGWTLFALGELGDADSVTRLSLDMRSRLFGEAHPETAESQNSLAGILQQLGRIDEAEPLYRHALDTRQKTLGPSNPLTGYVMNNLAGLLELRGQTVTAESLYRAVVDIDRRLYGPDSPRMTTALVNLGRVLGALQRYDEAEAFIREAHRIDLLQGPNHPFVAYDLRTLGDLMLRKSDLVRAEDLFGQALAIYQKQASDPITTGSTLRGLAQVRLAQGRAGEAEATLREALQLWSEMPESQPDKAYLAGLLGVSLARQERDAEAERLLVASRAVLMKAEPGRPREKSITAALGELLRRTGRPGEADQLNVIAPQPR